MSSTTAPRRRKTPAKQPVVVLEAQLEQSVVPYDENLLERARTQWQFGDWQSLAQLDRDTLQHHPDRAKLALLAAAGRLQTDNAAEARQFVRFARDWGVSKRLVSQILIAGVHNSLGRAAAIGNQQRRALQHFENSISIGTPGSDVHLLVRARSDEQSRQLALHDVSKLTVKPINSAAAAKSAFDVTGANRLISGISLTEQSKKRWPYFLKIEELQVSVFLHLVADTMPACFFDIGANVGFYTLIAQKYFPKLRCIAFEPTPDTFSNLLENIKANHKDGGAEAECLALSSKQGTVEFGDFGDCSGKNAILSTSIHEECGLKKRLSVATESLDSKYAGNQGRIIVKIDTEGHEMEVIKGGRKFFRSNEVVLQVETGHKENADELDELIRNFKLDLLFRLGPDSYYTNIPDLLEKEKSLHLLERANRFVISHRWDVDQSFG